MKKLIVVLGIAFAIICMVSLTMISGMEKPEETAISVEHSYGEIMYAYAHQQYDNVDKVIIDGIEIEDGREYMNYVIYENGAPRWAGKVLVSYAEEMVF